MTVDPSTISRMPWTPRGFIQRGQADSAIEIALRDLSVIQQTLTNVARNLPMDESAPVEEAAGLIEAATDSLHVAARVIEANRLEG